MSRKGLIGLVAIVVLMMLASPVMAVSKNVFTGKNITACVNLTGWEKVKTNYTVMDSDQFGTLRIDVYSHNESMTKIKIIPQDGLTLDITETTIPLQDGRATFNVTRADDAGVYTITIQNADNSSENVTVYIAVWNITSVKVDGTAIEGEGATDVSKIAGETVTIEVNVTLPDGKDEYNVSEAWLYHPAFGIATATYESSSDSTVTLKGSVKLEDAGNSHIYIFNVTLQNGSSWITIPYGFDTEHKLITRVLNVQPTEISPGHKVKVTGYGFTSNGDVYIYINNSTWNYKLAETKANDTGYIKVNITIPSNVAPGSYSISALDIESGVKSGYKEIKVLQAPKLGTLPVTLELNKDVLRQGEELRVVVSSTNTTKLDQMDISVVIINEANWKKIKENYIDKSLPVYGSWLIGNATDIIDGSKKDKKVNSSDNLPFVYKNNSIPVDKYYIVVFNNTSVDDKWVVDIYNDSVSFVVKSNVTNATLEELGIKWEVVKGRLNVSDINEGEKIKIPINATKKVNIAIVKQDVWNKLYENRSTITKDDVFNNANWSKADYQGNTTFEIPSTGWSVGTYVVVIFNTTDSYIYYFNNSTTFNIYPIPDKVALDKLASYVKLNATEMTHDGAIKLTIVPNGTVMVAVLNETAWNGINKSVALDDSKIKDNATGYYGDYWTVTGSQDIIIKDLIPDRYVIVIWKNTSVGIGNKHYVTEYNDSLKFDVVYTAKKVSLDKINVTKVDVPSAVNFGDNVTITLNVTGTVKVAIINETAWNELKSKKAIRNKTLCSKAKFNATITTNKTLEPPTVKYNMYPTKYYVVLYNTSAVNGIEYVNSYNDDYTFEVKSVAKKVDLSELADIYLNKTTVYRGESFVIGIQPKTKVNVIIINETSWDISKYPKNSTLVDSSVWSKTNVESATTKIVDGTETNTWEPGKYYVVVYTVYNDVIAKYNDDTTIEVMVKATKVNLTDLADYIEVTPKEVKAGEEIKVVVAGIKARPLLLAVIPEDKYTTPDNTLNESVVNASVRFYNLSATPMVTINTTGMAGTYVMLLYNTTTVNTKAYVNLFNDSIKIKVTPPVVTKPDLKVESIITPEKPVVNETVTVKAKIANVGNADAEAFNVSLYANDSLVDTKTVESLTAGNSTTVEFSWTPTEAKTYMLKVVADVDKAVDESNETNNEMTKSVVVVVKLPTGSKDLDGDGLYEDVNGNGKLDFGDVVMLFKKLEEWRGKYDKYYDFNSNERLDFGDIVKLFKIVP